MRLFSWYGLSALLLALGCGYVAGVAHRPTTCNSCCPPSIPSQEEEALAPPPGLALETQHLTPPEVIDLTCPPNVVIPFELCTQTNEPPVADATPSIRQTTFEVPAGSDDAIEPIPFMPYLETDEFAPERFHTGIRPAAPSATAIALGYSTWSQILTK